MTPEADPVLIRRARIAHWCSVGKRVGYTLYSVAVVVFFVGFVVGWKDWLVAVIVASMAVGGVVLVPAIIFAYGVKAADRADRGEPDGH